MKLKILQENLSNAINLASYFVSANPRLPILSNIYFKGEKTGLVIVATDLETGIKKEIPAKVEKQGETTVSARTITELVSFLPKETVELFLEKDQLKISCGKTFSSLPTVAASEFPPFMKQKRKAKGLKEFSFKGELFFNWLKKVSFAAASDEGRPVLTGAFFRKGDDGLQIAGTDGYRLSFIKTQEKKWERDVNIPAVSLQMLEKVMEKDEEVCLSFFQKDGQVLFSQKETWVTTRLIEGEYPDFSKIIPQENEVQVVVNKEELLRSIKAASIFARESANIVRLKVERGKLIVSANAPQTGENKIEIEVVSKGRDTEIAFNYRYILDFLGVVEKNEVMLEFSGGLRPGLFKEKGNENFLHVIMPVKVQD